MKATIHRTAGWFLMSAILATCAMSQGAENGNGPRFLTSGRITENGQYAEAGIQFR